jgi:peroxin-16
MLRLVLLKITRQPLLSPPIPERDFDPTSLPPSSNTSSPTLAPSSPSYSPPATPEHLRNNHVPLPLHPLLAPSPPIHSDTSVEDYLLPKALTTSSVKPSASLVRALSTPQDWLAESIYISRPFIYGTPQSRNRIRIFAKIYFSVSLLTAYRGSNQPLVVALVMELVSRNLRRTPPPSAALERAEYARRDRAMLWYLLRGSIWEFYTRSMPHLSVSSKISLFPDRS